MNPRITRKLRMKAGAKCIALPHSNDISILTDILSEHASLSQRARPARQPRQHLDLGIVRLHGEAISRRLRGRNDCAFAASLSSLDAVSNRQDLLDDGRADEDGAEDRRRRLRWLREKRQIQIGREALDLSAEVVAVDAHVQPADQLLAARLRAVGALRQQDQARAGAPGGLAVDSGGAVSASVARVARRMQSTLRSRAVARGVRCFARRGSLSCFHRPG